MPARESPTRNTGDPELVVIAKVDTRVQTGSMVVSKTGAAGIGEAETRFADQGPSVGRAGQGDVQLRPLRGVPSSATWPPAGLVWLRRRTLVSRHHQNASTRRLRLFR
jgi:hypothetical protein